MRILRPFKPGPRKVHRLDCGTRRRRDLNRQRRLALDMRLHRAAGKCQAIAEGIASRLPATDDAAGETAAIEPNMPAVAGRKNLSGPLTATPSAATTSTPATTAARKSAPLTGRSARLRQQHREHACHRMRDRRLVDAVIFLRMDLIGVDEGRMWSGQPLAWPAEHETPSHPPRSNPPPRRTRRRQAAHCARRCRPRCCRAENCAPHAGRRATGPPTRWQARGRRTGQPRGAMQTSIMILPTCSADSEIGYRRLGASSNAKTLLTTA